MNGLQIIELNRASFMEKLLRQEPRENAFVEINNLLACVPILEVDRETIENCLSRYEITHEKARSRLLNFYSIILKFFIGDLTISNRQLQELNHLQSIFNLDDAEISSIHQAITQPIYKRYVINAVSDGILTDEQKNTLNELSERLRIPKSLAKQVYVGEAGRYLESVLKNSLEDGMLSDGEENELRRIAKNLQVELKFTENAEQNLRHFKYLWQLHIGNLPKIPVDIYLEKEEFCPAFIKATFYEISNVHHPLKYSGYQDLRGNYGRGFHSGRIPINEIGGKAMRLLDRGTLYFTNKRLLFNGTNGTREFHLLNLIGGSFYKNGMLVEQKRGRDHFFEFSGDSEALRLIFNSLMTKSRQ